MRWRGCAMETSCSPASGWVSAGSRTDVQWLARMSPASRTAGETITTKTLSSRELDQDVRGAKRAADDGPVFITDRGRPTHVLLSIDAYQRLLGGHRTIGELLALPGSEDVDFEAPHASGLFGIADLA